MHFLKRIRSSGAARIAAASYFSFASLAASTFVSIPVAVYYLDRAEIGLWAVVNQVVGYLLWMDLGVGQATGRKMTDAVVNRDAQELNRWWSATRFVLLVQAGLVLLIGLFGHPWASQRDAPGCPTAGFECLNVRGPTLGSARAGAR